MGIVGAVLALLTACGSSGGGGDADDDVLATVEERGKLIVATNPQYPPASFLDTSGEWQGFDIDVAKMIADELGVDVEFVTPAWNVMTGGRWSGRWDIAVGSMNPLATRQEKLNFVDPPYYHLPAVAAVRDDSDIDSVEKLSGKTIGANGGTTYEAYVRGELEMPNIPYDGGSSPVESVFTDATFKGYPTDTAAIDDLVAGRLDAAVAAPTVFQAAIDSGADIRLLETDLFYEPLAIAGDASANSEELIEKISEMVETWHEDGTLSSLSEEWFGFDYSKTQT